MTMDIQTLLSCAIVGLAACYVGRSLWPRRRGPGCGACPRNQARRDDYA